MIKYDKLWKTMKEKGITQYMLVKEYNISKSLLVGTEKLHSHFYVSTFREIISCSFS